MDVETYRQQFKQEDAVGWLAMDAALEKIYGPESIHGTVEPRHYAPPLHYRLGGRDPLDGISMYDNHQQTLHRHIVSYGMSSLYYDEESAGTEFSGWGFEFTMRVLPFVQDLDAETRDGKLVKNEPYWVAEVMNNLARYVFDNNRWFEHYHFIPANGPIRLETDTLITALAFAPDVELGSIATPHGQLDFLQMVGLTDAEYQWLKVDGTTVRTEQLINAMRKDNPMLILDLNRKHSYV